MRPVNQGFTIIEVSIFLAISGLLLTMVFIGTGSLAARQRFSDTTDSAQAYLQAQYDEVVNGVNTRIASAYCPTDGGASSQPGASQRCLLLGKLIQLKSASQFEAHYIVSTIKLPDASVGSGVSDATKLQQIGIQVSSVDTATYDLKWGGAVSSASRSSLPPVGSGRGNVNTIAFIQLPDSSRIVQLYYYDIDPANPTNALVTAIATDTGAYSPAPNASGPSLAICIKNDNDFVLTHPRAAVVFGQGSGAGTITTDYNPGATLCP